MTLSTEKLLSAIDSRRTVPIAWGTVWLLSLVALVMREPDRSVVGTLPADTPLWQSRVIIYLLHSAATLLSCVLLIHLNNTCNLMQRRTWLPATTLLFLNLCNPAFADRPNTALLLSPLLVVWLYLLFTSYQKEGREAAYGIGLLTTACTLLWPPAAAMIVALGTGPAYMQNLTWKSATAFLLGIATPVWLLFVANIIFDLHIYYTFDQFVSYIPGLPYSLQVNDPTELTGYGMAALIGVSCCLSGSYLITRHKIQIWRSNRFLLLLLLFILAAALLNPDRTADFLPWIHIVTAQASAYYLIHARNRYAPWQACVVVAAYILLYIWNF